MIERQSLLRPGTVILLVPEIAWWKIWRIVLNLLYSRIQRIQKRWFAPMDQWLGRIFTESCHVMIVCKDGRVYDPNFPRMQWVMVDQLAQLHFRAYWYAGTDLSTEPYASILHELCDESVRRGDIYDVLDLIQFELVDVIGYSGPDVSRNKIAGNIANAVGLDPKGMVCSTSSRSKFEGLRKIIERDYYDIPQLKRLFTLPTGAETLVELTLPEAWANFSDDTRAHSADFVPDFRFIGEWKNGKKIR